MFLPLPVDVQGNIRLTQSGPLYALYTVHKCMLPRCRRTEAWPATAGPGSHYSQCTSFWSEGFQTEGNLRVDARPGSSYAPLSSSSAESSLTLRTRPALVIEDDCRLLYQQEALALTWARRAWGDTCGYPHVSTAQLAICLLRKRGWARPLAGAQKPGLNWRQAGIALALAARCGISGWLPWRQRRATKVP